MGFLGLGQSRVKGGVFRVAAHGAHDFYRRYFQRHVHAAFQVEAQAQFALPHFAVGEGPEHRRAPYRIEVVLAARLVEPAVACGIGHGLILYPTRDVGEEEKVRAQRRNNDGERNDESFITHYIISEQLTIISERLNRKWRMSRSGPTIMDHIQNCSLQTLHY